VTGRWERSTWAGRALAIAIAIGRPRGLLDATMPAISGDPRSKLCLIVFGNPVCGAPHTRTPAFVG